MAETKKSRSRSGLGALLATLAGAAVLVMLGFGLGLLAGAAYEDPTLVADHLAGRSEMVALDDSAAPASPEPVRDFGVAVEPPRPPPEPARQPLGSGATASPASPSAPAPVAAPPPRRTAAPAPTNGSFVIQVGAFGESAGARRLRDSLRAKGFSTEVVELTGAARYKVRVGPIATRGEADRMAGVLKREHDLNTWVVAR